MAANYDRIAGIYDNLAQLVFGKSIRKAQVSLLPYIAPGSRILIVGGGSGWILEELCQIHPSGMIIDYVEISAGMISLAAKRDSRDNIVNLIHLPVESFVNTEQYDIVFTPFLFDNFGREKLDAIFIHLLSMLKSRGHWLYVDFVEQIDSPIWQKAFLKLMYIFFRLTCHIEASHLISMDGYFSRGFAAISERSFYFNFITARVYRKH